ncbi:MAG TPA: hypothetical protein VLT33_23225 [Labilithrix sp.]|nr:hypothetical protein [Labilithrix sp.]
MGLGFQLAESFSGSYYRLDEPFRDHAIRVSLRLGVNGLRRFLKERRVEAKGLIFAEGLAERDREGVPLEGSLAMKLFDEKRIPYDLSFEGDDGRTYRLRGQRDFFVHDAVDSLTILPASLYDDAGVEAGRAVLRFDPRTDLGPLVKSFRPRVRVSRLASGLD